ncbi:MAG: alpha/beta hydrolase [Caulobacteraceae bacterium]|nr:alpha/beta hydrolase [Caulobacteraceae bacterium]
MRTLLLAAASATLLLVPAAIAAPATEGPTEISASGPGGELKGFWRGPASVSAPIAVFVPGSGPTDHDGNNPLGVAGSPYGKLMQALAEEGIATVAIDKRGQFASAGAAFGPEGPTIAAYAEDVHAWIRQIREETGAPCVWLIGHSEGSLVVLAAAQAQDGVCGVISISGAGRRLSDVIREQINQNPANPPEIVQQAEAAITSLEAGRKVDLTGMHPALAPLFNPQAQNLLISMFAYDPADLVRRYSGPVLVVQGSTDLQVKVKDAERLAAARAGVSLVVMDGMNHVLRAAPGDNVAANAATYGEGSAPVFPGLAANIANFIKTHTR